MNIEEMTKLIKAVADNKLTSFEIKDGEFKLSIKCEKEAPQIVMAQAPAVPVAAAVPAAASSAFVPAAPAAAAPAAAPAPAAASEASEEGGKVITSPLVGTFYSASSPDAEPFVKIGDTVKEGQVVAIVEAMKLMNEIESDCSGTVVEILAENGQAVEYGQPLFRVEP